MFGKLQRRVYKQDLTKKHYEVFWRDLKALTERKTFRIGKKLFGEGIRRIRALSWLKLQFVKEKTVFLKKIRVDITKGFKRIIGNMFWLFKRKKVADKKAITPCVCDNGKSYLYRIRLICRIIYRKFKIKMLFNSRRYYLIMFNANIMV